MCKGQCSEPQLHRIRPDFKYCPTCRRYAVVWWLGCLGLWMCEDCGTYLEKPAEVAPAA